MGWIRSDLTLHLMEWAKPGVSLMMPRGLRPIAYARNWCARKFIDDTDYDYLWFIDADTLPPIDALKLLIDQDAPIISGIVNVGRRGSYGPIETVPAVMDKGDDGYHSVGYESGVHRVDVCGAACMMVRRDVFETLPFPFFTEQPWGKMRGEDLRFCIDAGKHGFNTYAHFDVRCYHWKEVDL